MLPRILLLTLLAGSAGCAHQSTRPRADEDEAQLRDRYGERAEPAVPPPAEATAGRGPASAPSISPQVGLDALRDWALACYRLGVAHDPAFPREGSVLIRWDADREGSLMRLDFAVDSFRGWQINAQGDTLADCISKRAQARTELRWSASGSAPLRFSGAQ